MLQAFLISAMAEKSSWSGVLLTVPPVIFLNFGKHGPLCLESMNLGFQLAVLKASTVIPEQNMVIKWTKTLSIFFFTKAHRTKS